MQDETLFLQDNTKIVHYPETAIRSQIVEALRQAFTMPSNISQELPFLTNMTKLSGFEAPTLKE
jgi:hypothetical protein